MLAGLTWFVTLGARYLRPLFVRRMAWRTLDGVIAVVMVTIGVSLLLPLL